MRTETCTFRCCGSVFMDCVWRFVADVGLVRSFMMVQFVCFQSDEREQLSVGAGRMTGRCCCGAEVEWRRSPHACVCA